MLSGKPEMEIFPWTACGLNMDLPLGAAILLSGGADVNPPAVCQANTTDQNGILIFTSNKY